jgi:hypothetical protein
LTYFLSQAQVSVVGLSPIGAQGNYNFTWAGPNDGWGCPDFNVPGTFIQGDLMMVNDGTPGTNATYGNLLSEEGCNPSPVDAYAGKICVIRRNTCDFSTKALEAQAAGALGVIIVNRDPSVFDMGAGASGPAVSIPVVMLSSTDGNYLISLMQNSTVNMFIGNVQGSFPYNLSLNASTTFIPERGMTPSGLAQNGSEFNFNVGTTISNYGSLAQSGVSLNVNVVNPNNVTVYNQTINNISINAADTYTLAPGTLPIFQLANYPAGEYQLNYNISSPNSDAFSQDNSLSFRFSINNDVYSFANPEPTSGLPRTTTFLKPSVFNSEYTMCNVIDDPNASRLAVQGMHFAAATYDGTELIGTEIELKVYRWEDIFTDLNDPNYGGLNSLTEIASGWYTYTANLQEQMVYAPLNQPIALEDNQRYLTCVSTYNSSIYLGFSSDLDYTQNLQNSSQPLYIVSVDGITNAYINLPNSSWGIPSLGVKTVNCPPASTQTITTSSCVSYTSMSGVVYTQSGAYQEIVPNMYGCDSIVVNYNLTINATEYTGTTYSVISPSCTAPSDGQINVSINSPSTVAGDYILISEYYSGTGPNKAIEIYNASNHSWDLGNPTYDPSSGYFLGGWYLTNSAGQQYFFPQDLIIEPYTTLVIKNPLSNLFSNLSSSVIDGSEMTLGVNIDFAGSPTPYLVDVATPIVGQTIVRNQNVTQPNFTAFDPAEWTNFPLTTANLGSHFNTVPVGYSILWANGTTGPTLAGLAPGVYEYSVVHDASGCVIPGDSITLEGFIYSDFSDTICDGENYNWNGQLYSTPGQYTQTLVNQYGCDSIVTLNLYVNYNDILSIQPSVSFGNAPLNVAFSNQTANIGNYNFTWYFGDGSSQLNNNPFLSHIYSQGGYSDVTISAENLTTGCVSTSTFDNLIFVLGGVNCAHIAQIDTTGPLTTCSGDSLLLGCNTDPTFTYQWNRNGVPVSGATGSSWLPLVSGIYTVTIYQNNCPVTSNGVSITVNPLPAIPTISSSGTINLCSGGTMTLSVPSNYQTYNWSNGATTSSTSVTQSGIYSVAVSNAFGCVSSSNPYTVNASFMQTPNVCIVGLDSLTSVNRIVWEKPISNGIDSFYVYRESNVSNVYYKIGATDYNALAVLLDPNSNPAIQAYRYKLSILDTCGSETLLSDFHKTIHLTINAGVGGAWNLIWSHYEGINFGSYNIYRGTDPSNISLLTTIQSNLNSYSDLTPPAGAVYYQIEIVNPTSCDPAKVVGYDYSRSNIVYNGLNGVADLEYGNVHLYPNPTENNIHVSITSELVGNRYYLTDCSGRLIFGGELNELTSKLDMTELSKGAYYLKIENYPETLKVIKQ